MKKHLPIVICVGLLSIAPAAYAGGLPQLDHTWFSNQVLWLLVTFVALYAVISWFVAPTIDGVLTNRASEIATAIQDAEEAKRMAETTRTQFESDGQEARIKAAELMAKVQAENAAEAAEASAKLSTDLARKAEQAEARIEDAKHKALGSIHTATVSLTQTMAEKLLGHSVAEQNVEASVSRLLKPTTKAEAA